MSNEKTKRNARIVRLRKHFFADNPPPSWTQIADRINKEFPDDPITRQRAQQIYAKVK